MFADNGGSWDNYAQALVDDPALNASVGVIGMHYPSGSNSSALARSMAQPLWASEDDSTYFDAAGIVCFHYNSLWYWIQAQAVAALPGLLIGTTCLGR